MDTVDLSGGALAEQSGTLTLFARDASKADAPDGARVIEGDVLDATALGEALQGQGVLCANLGGEVGKQVKRS